MVRRNSFSRAAAVSYNERLDPAPVVAAAGDFAVADRIVSIARRYGIPIVENPALAAALARLPVESHIPAQLYHAVAVIIRELEARPAPHGNVQ